MISWLSANIGTIVITLVLIALVISVIAGMIKDKRKGKHSCSCGCKNCAMQGMCHKDPHNIT
ncbi:MAG: FeoB-associated Cys-rich membrane protein [Oscillospiraceae bacterium]|nr:FeoB-associated Cys-rich membrane protein [Oscillospiraceae bacterium]